VVDISCVSLCRDAEQYGEWQTRYDNGAETAKNSDGQPFRDSIMKCREGCFPLGGYADNERKREMSGQPIAQEDLRILFEAARWILLFHHGSAGPLAARSDDADGGCRLPVPAVLASQRRVVVCQS